MEVSADLVRLSEGVGANVARRYGRLADVDEFVSVARYVLVVELDRRPDLAGADLRLVARAIERRLVDYYRIDEGRYRPKAHARKVRHPGTFRSEARDGGSEDVGLDLPDRDVDVAAEVVDRLVDLSLSEIVLLCLDAFDEEVRPTIAAILYGLARGERLAAIGERLGISESRVSQYLAEIAVRVRGHAYAAERLDVLVS